MFESKERKSLDEYINIAKWDIVLYVIVSIIIVLFFQVSLKHLFEEVTLFCYSIIILMIGSKSIVYYNLINIKKYIEKNDLINDIGKIDYWNEKNCLLTENFIIISEKFKIFHLKYVDVKKMNIHIKFGGKRKSAPKEYLHIYCDDCDFFIQDSNLAFDSVDKISKYLLNKNSNIVVGKDKIVW